MILTFIVIIYLFLFEGGLFVEIIQSPSVDPVNHGSSLNLTCSAKLKKKYINFPYKYEQPCKIDWFFNRTQVHSCSRECLHANGVMNCTLTLGERQNQPKGIVNFACKASNGHSQCTFRRISIGKHVIQVFTYVLICNTWPRPW